MTLIKTHHLQCCLLLRCCRVCIPVEILAYSMMSNSLPLLDYLRKEDVERYRELIGRLGLRR